MVFHGSFVILCIISPYICILHANCLTYHDCQGWISMTTDAHIREELLRTSEKRERGAWIVDSIRR
jgi:hypothetical protein